MYQKCVLTSSDALRTGELVVMCAVSGLLLVSSILYFVKRLLLNKYEKSRLFTSIAWLHFGLICELVALIGYIYPPYYRDDCFQFYKFFD